MLEQQQEEACRKAAIEAALAKPPPPHIRPRIALTGTGPVEAFLAALAGTAVAQAFRFSRWGYAAVNAAHVFGIALLVGSIIPLNLRIFGVWRSVPRWMLVRVLVSVAATGLAIAVVAGFLLFSMALEYAGNESLQIKLLLMAVGVTSAMALHGIHGFLLEDAGRGQLMGHAVVSRTCWLGALACGR